MKNKLISVFLVLLFCVSGFNLFTACNNIPNISKLELSFIKNLKIDIEDTQGFAIKKVGFDNTKVNSKKANPLLSFGNVVYADEEEITEKYMLFTTTQIYNPAKVTYNENSIEKVTFTKNTNITEDVYDAEGNLISSDTKITQEEIPGQINRMYVCGNFTFLQFVPLLNKSWQYNYYDENGKIQSEYLEIRPKTLWYDLDGVADFDKFNYYSSALSQSFVIDNNTGLIYKIENFRIGYIDATGLIITDFSYYKMFIKDNNLVFLEIAPGNNISVKSVVQDKYGWVYVCNKYIDYKDEQNKIIYYTGNVSGIEEKSEWYMIDKQKQVYACERIPSEYLSVPDKYLVSAVMVDGNKEPPPPDISISGLTYTDAAGGYVGNTAEGYYKGKQVINFIDYSYKRGWIGWKDEVDKPLQGVEDSIYILKSDVTGGCFWLDDNCSAIILNNNNDWYYKTLNIDDYLNTNTVLTLADFTKIADDLYFFCQYNSRNIKHNNFEDYYMDIDGNKKAVDHVFYKLDFTSRTYYQLVQNGDTVELVELEEKHYTQDVFIFQPINQ